MKIYPIGLIYNILIFLFLFEFNIRQHQCTVVELTDKNFGQVVTSRPFTMVVFFTDWCHHCHDLLPELEEADNVLVENRIHAIAKVNCETTGEDTCNKMGIKGYPTVLVMLYGKVSGKYTGEPDSKKITDFIMAKLKETLGTIIDTPASTTTNNYSPNFWQPQPTPFQQPSYLTQNIGTPNMNMNPSYNNWMQYDSNQYNQNFNNMQGEKSFGIPTPNYPQYGNPWENFDRKFSIFPPPPSPPTPANNMMYPQTMDYFQKLIGNNQPYKNNEFYQIPSPTVYDPVQSPRQYLDSITWNSKVDNQWFNPYPYSQPLNNLFGYPRNNINWVEYAGFKKQDIASNKKDKEEEEPKSEVDWVWNPDFDLGHRPAVRQYMIPVKYRPNAIKSVYLKGIVNKYLNEQGQRDEQAERKHSIPETKSKKEIHPLFKSHESRGHPSKSSDALKLIVDALKNVDHK